MKNKPIHTLIVSNDSAKTVLEFLTWCNLNRDAINLDRNNSKLIAEKELAKLGFDVLPINFTIREGYPIADFDSQLKSYVDIYHYYVDIDWDATLKDQDE